MPNNLTRCPVGCFDLSAHAVNVAHACPDEGRVFGGEAFAFRSARPVSSPSPCCHPERGRFPADEGPAVRLTCPFRLFLFFSFSFLRCHPERGRCLSFLFFFSSFLLFFFSSFLLFFLTLSSRARRFLPTRDLLFASHRLSLCLALRLLRFLPRRWKWRSLLRQVLPRRVCLFDKHYLFGPPPALDFLFPPDRRPDIAKNFEMD